jgi:transposase-like protein
MMSKLAEVGDFCPNETCPDYGKCQNKQQGNIIKFGKTQAGRQRYKCNTCNKSFTETKGTLFYRRRTPEREILETLALIAEGNRISSLVRAKGHKKETIIAWIREAGQHAAKIEAVLLADYQLSRGQIDGLWAYVGNKRSKKTIQKRLKVVSFGDRRCWIWIAVCGWPGGLPKQRPKPPRKFSKP